VTVLSKIKKLYFLRFLRAQWDGWLKMFKTI
jgi:hypothetical protein